MKSKLLTVIVPSYNMENYLRACLGSVLSDNPMADRLDVIVVNDGSKDGTSAIAHEIEAAHPGVIRVIDKENGNYGSCVNAGIREACGRFVKILDADDTFDTIAFERYLRFLDELADGSAPDVVFNDFVEVDPDGKTVVRHSFPFLDGPGAALSDFDYSEPDRKLWMHAVAYRLDLLRRIGYRQTEGVFYSDQEWAVVPMMDARSFRHSPEPVYRYLVGRAGQTVAGNVRLRHYGMHLRVEKRIVETLVENRRNHPDAEFSFAERQIENHLASFYSEFLLVHPKMLPEGELREFDGFLRAVAPDFHRYAGTLSTAFTPLRFRFRFVRHWRKAGKRNSLAFRLADFGLSVRRYRNRFAKHAST